MQLIYTILILTGLLLGCAAQSEAQFLNLNKLKEKTSNAISDLKNGKKPESEKKSSQSREKKGSASTPGKSEISDMYYNGDEVPAILLKIPTSNMHANYDRNFPAEPPVAAGANAVYVDGDINYFGPFSDGVAYMKSYESGNFFFDKSGKVLFTTDMDEGDDSTVPLFENGIVMDIAKRRLPDCKVKIRDKNGSVIKEIKGAYDATNFKNGVAGVIFTHLDKDGLTVYEVKYVDRNGNFIFPEMNFSTHFLGTVVKPFLFYKFIREESEGLTAFGKVSEKAEQTWGFRDKTGKVVIPAEYLEVSDFHEGLAAVKVKGEGGDGARDRWGFIDKTGKMVIPAKYSIRPTDFNSGMAVVTSRKGECSYIDQTGKTKFGPVGTWDDENAKDGQIVAIGPFLNGYAFVHFLVLEPGYQLARRFMGVIDTSFRILSWGELGLGGYDELIDSYISDGKTYLVDPGANSKYWVTMPGFTRTVKNLKDTYSEGLARFRTINSSGHSGYVNEKGEIALEIRNNEF